MPRFSKEQFIDMMADILFKKQEEDSIVRESPSAEKLYLPDPPEPIYMRDRLLRDYRTGKYGNRL